MFDLKNLTRGPGLSVIYVIMNEKVIKYDRKRETVCAFEGDCELLLMGTRMKVIGSE